MDGESLVRHPITARALHWERSSLPAKLALGAVYLPTFVRLLVRRERIPITEIQAKHPIVFLLMAMTIGVLASSMCDFREAGEPWWLLGQVWRRPVFFLTAFCLFLSVCTFVVVAQRPLRRRLYWRAAVYGLFGFTALQLVWILWLSLGLCAFPVQFSPLNPAHTVLDPSIWQQAAFYVTVIVAMLNPLVFLLILPISVLRRGHEPRHRSVPPEKKTGACTAHTMSDTNPAGTQEQ